MSTSSKRGRREPCRKLGAVLACALALGSCTTKTPDYCDRPGPCATPGTVCDVPAKTCVVTDGGVVDDADKAKLKHRWDKIFAGNVSESHVVIDTASRVAVFGTCDGRVGLEGKSLEGSLFLASFSITGETRFARAFSAVRGAGLTLDSANRLHLVGTFRQVLELAPGTQIAPARGGTDIFTAIFDATGMPRDLEVLGGGDDEGAGGIVLDRDGNEIIAGSFRGELPWYATSLLAHGEADMFFARLLKKPLALSYGGAADEAATAIAIDEDDNIYLVGTFKGSIGFGGKTLILIGKTDAFLVSYDSAGKERFTKRIGGPLDDSAAAVVVGQDRVCVGGRFHRAADFDGAVRTGVGDMDGFVACYKAADGALRFVKTFGGSADDEALALAMDPEANIYVAGSFRDVANVDGQRLQSAGGTDAVLASWTKDGVARFARRFGGSGDDVATGVAATGSSVVLSGTFEGRVDFGGGSRDAGVSTAGFVVQLR